MYCKNITRVKLEIVYAFIAKTAGILYITVEDINMQVSHFWGNSV